VNAGIREGGGKKAGKIFSGDKIVSR
jgi:hypothetical protein